MTRFDCTNKDLRVQRTRELIQEALIELTIQKGFAAVTVHDITKYARINRATFYRHYQDKFDLIDQYTREVYQLLDTPSVADQSHPENQTAGLVKMLEHVSAHAKFYRVMLGKNGDPAFAEKIRQYVEKRMRHALPEAFLQDKTLAELYLSYLSSGSVGAVVWWLEHDMPVTPTELADISFRFGAAALQMVNTSSRETFSAIHNQEN